MKSLDKIKILDNMETIAILKKVNTANKKLAELKGILKTIPNERILINFIFLQEAKDKTITVGEEFNREIALKGVSAYDKEDGDLTDKIEVESTVDRHKVGEYTVTYTVSDTQGATATKTIKVTVKAKEENKEESKKEEKEDKVKTSVSVSTGLFAGMTGISAVGMGI